MGALQIPAFVNPDAGNADAARGALRAAGGFDVREVRPAILADHVRAAISEGASRVLVAGGDGSIGSAAAALAGSGVELAILPSGTLNHLAKDLSIPLDLESAARVAMDGRVTSVDSAVVNDRVFLNTSAVGSYVTFVRLRERLEHGMGYRFASLVAAARLLVRLPTFRVTIQLEDMAREYLTPAVLVAVGERELKLPTLGARVLDGRRGLHVMVIRRRSGARTLALALAAAARGVEAVAKTPALDSFLVNACRIEPRTHVASVDGELVTVRPPLEYRYVPGRLRVIVPNVTPE